VCAQLDLFGSPSRAQRAAPAPGLHVTVYTLSGPIEVRAETADGALLARRNGAPVQLSAEEEFVARAALRSEGSEA
jgi:hypothetical protein